MNRSEFLAYVEDYNRGLPELLPDHYTEDLVFENFGLRHEGPAAFAFITDLMTLLHTRLVPDVIVIEGDHVAMFGHMEVEARVEHTNPAVGTMRQGDRMRSVLFAFYTTRGDKISHVRIAGWQPEVTA